MPTDPRPEGLPPETLARLPDLVERAAGRCSVCDCETGGDACNWDLTIGEVTPSRALDRLRALARALLAERAKGERLRERILAILDGDQGFALGEPWAKDGSSSKHDRCVHGNWRYDDCPVCLDAAIRAALREPPAGTETTRGTQQEGGNG